MADAAAGGAPDDRPAHRLGRLPCACGPSVAPQGQCPPEFARTGSSCFARSTQPSPRGRAAQLELPRCERAGNPQRTFNSALASWLRPSARTARYVSGCRPARAWQFELRAQPEARAESIWLATCPSARPKLTHYPYPELAARRLRSEVCHPDFATVTSVIPGLSVGH